MKKTYFFAIIMFLLISINYVNAFSIFGICLFNCNSVFNYQTNSTINNGTYETYISLDKYISKSLVQKQQILFNKTTRKIRDTTGLWFEFNPNGVLKVNGSDYMAFAVKGNVNGQEIIKTTFDYNWVWSYNITNTSILIIADNNNSNFRWIQYFNFSNDKSVKISNYLYNNFANSTNTNFYYLFSIKDMKEIYFDKYYNLTKRESIHKTSNFDNLDNKINLDSSFAFDFKDIIKEGLNLNDVYLGNGSIINLPTDYVLALGFTKGNGEFNKGQSIFIDPTFSTGSVYSSDVAALDEKTVVVVWCDDGELDLTYAIYNTSGTALISPTDIKTDFGDCGASTAQQPRVSVAAINSTHFAVVYQGLGIILNDLWLTIYDRTGTKILDHTKIQTVATNSYTTNVRMINSTHMVISYWDAATSDYFFEVFDVHGNQITDAVQLDDSAQTSYSIEAAVFNETHIGFVWYDGGDLDATYSLYNPQGTNLHTTTDVDTDVGNNVNNRVSIAAVNSTTAVICYTDNTDDDISFVIWDYNTTAKVSVTDVDTQSTDQMALNCNMLNSTHFIISWYENDDDFTHLAVYDINGNLIHGPTTVQAAAVAFRNTAFVTAYDQKTGIGLCDNNFALLYYKDNTNDYTLDFYKADLTSWNGSCDNKLPLSTLYLPSNNSVQTTTKNILSVTYTDPNSQIGTLLFVNNTDHSVFCTNSSVASGSNVNCTVTVSDLTELKWYVNSSDGTDNTKNGVWNFSIVLPSNSCTYGGSGIWNVDCSDFCQINDTISTLPSYINFTGTGEFIINNTVETNFTTLQTKPSTCKIVTLTQKSGKLIFKK